MQCVVASEHFGVADRLRAAAQVGDEAARLAHQQAAGGGVPRLEAAFPEAVEAPGGDPGEIERGGAETADSRDLRRERSVDRGPFGGIAGTGEGNARGDQALVEPPPRRDAQALFLQPGTAAFSAQKLSSVTGW